MDWRDNPFPASAVARFSPVDVRSLSIETPAVLKAISYVDQYLDVSGSSLPHGDGNVVAVVGEYGTGKTHLTIELLRRVKENAGEKIHSFYLDAPADTFLALYRDRFFRQLDRKDVRQRVLEYYSDIVAEELGDSPLTSDVALRLLDRELEPNHVVQEFGLSQSTLQEKLQDHLGRITEHEDFGTALGLFLRPEFEAAVWEWLGGHPADAVLRERGILRAIDNDISALEAIGVFAFLYGRQDHRFVLIIDEFEKVLSRDSRSVKSEASVLAFKKLLEIFGQARSLLILSGLPDFVEVLPVDAQQRISCLVRPTALSFVDVKDYIRLSLGREAEDLSPFNEDSIAYLVELAGGNARKVIRLCYHAFEASVSAGADLNRALLREVAREQFEISSPDDIRSEITRILDSNGWNFEVAKEVAEDPSVVVDYWLPVGQAGSGCAVIVTQSILHEHEAEVLVASGSVMLVKEPPIAAILIINGYLAESLRDAISAAYARVMSYSPMRFSDDFSAAVSAFTRRLQETSNEDRMSLVEAKLDQLLRQTTGVRRSIESVERNSSSSASSIEISVEAGLRRVFGALSGGFTTPSVALSGATERIFAEALQDVEATARRQERDIRDLFLGGNNLGDVRYTNEVAAVHVLLMLIKVFRDSIAELVASPDYGSHSVRGGAVEDACRLFDRYIREIDIAGSPKTLIRISQRSGNARDIRGLAEEVWMSLRR
ncbi:hypothetical protein [Streptomyces sp. SID1121]|uniref:hypothetical protein n=1 Tax=Streptomyces sp. SID1121 TaxID=3425888 RepID=UPI004056BD48